MFDRNSRGPTIDSTKAKNELRKIKKLIGARFDIVLQVWRFGHPLIKVEKSTSSEVILKLNNYFFIFLSSFSALVEPIMGPREFLSNILSFF